MLVACWDQNRGISTSRCSKTTCALLVADDGRADVPFDFVERIDPLAREEARVFNPGEPCRLDSRHVRRHRCRRRVVVCVLVDSTCGAAALCIFASERESRPSPRGHDSVTQL